MGFNKRTPATKANEEAFISGKPVSAGATKEPSSISSGRKFSIYSIYGTEKQKELLSKAAAEMDIPQAKLIQRYLFDRLEEEYGHLVQ